MFEVGYSEILVIAIVLIVVVGPKDLPKMLRAFGKATTKFRQMSGDFRKQFDDALKEAELDEVRKTISDVRKLDPRQQVLDVFNPLREVGNSLRADVNRTLPTQAVPSTIQQPAIVKDATASQTAIVPKIPPASKKVASKAPHEKPAVVKTTSAKSSIKGKNIQ